MVLVAINEIENCLVKDFQAGNALEQHKYLSLTVGNYFCSGPNNINGFNLNIVLDTIL